MKRWIEIELKNSGKQTRKNYLKEATKRLNAYMKFWPKMSALSLYSSIVKVKKYLRYYLKNLLKETEKSCRKKKCM